MINMIATQYIGKIITVKMDRPLGSLHPKHGFEYPVNYGFVPDTISGDGEELDAYVLGVDKPLDTFTGQCIAVIHRTDDDDDKLVVVPDGVQLSDDEIEKQTAFQEKWFKHIIIRNPSITRTHFGVYGAIIRDGKILLIKKARGPYTGLYDLPGGSPESNETFEQTLTREIKEETNCDVISITNQREKTIIFSDFTKASGETGVLQHRAILFDVNVSGEPATSGDGLDSNGAVWVETGTLTSENATPYALIAVGCEMLDIINEKDEVFNILPRKEAHAKLQLVRIAAVLVINDENKILLQKASPNKSPRFANKWTYSAAGHVDAGEAYEQAAIREGKEELGISIETPKYIGISRVIHEKTGKLGPFHHVFKTHSNGPFVMDETEAQELRFFTLNEIQEMILTHPDTVVDNLKEAIKFLS